jgi:hypothetical protein
MLQKILANTPLLSGLVSSGIALAIAFGLSLSDTQTGAIMGVIGAFTALMGALISPNVPVALTTPPGPAQK